MYELRTLRTYIYEAYYFFYFFSQGIYLKKYESYTIRRSFEMYIYVHYN